MNYQQGIEALKNGDFRTAAAQLERAARETGYTSEIINHAYTLALYRLNEKPRLADVSFRIATSMLSNDPATAMDYFQRALFAGVDSERVRNIGSIYENWKTPRQPVPQPGPVLRVAHVTGCLLSGHAPSQYVKMLVSSLKSKGVESIIFTTEWAASWFFNPAGVRQSQPIEVEGQTVIADVDGNFLERAERVAAAIRASGIPVVFFHGSLPEQITARVAAFGPGTAADPRQPWERNGCRSVRWLHTPVPQCP
jgi:hypothetical protein